MKIFRQKASSLLRLEPGHLPKNKKPFCNAAFLSRASSSGLGNRHARLALHDRTTLGASSSSVLVNNVSSATITIKDVPVSFTGPS